MANTITFTSLAPLMYAAMQKVAREPIGIINGVTINTSKVTEASFGDPVKSLVVSEALDLASYTPAMQVPESGDKTNTLDSFSLDQFVGKELPIVGETAKRLANVGWYGDWIQKEFEQIFRSIFNEIEAYMGTILKNGSSRAVGTAGTTPFATSINILAQTRKVLKDNGVNVDDGMLNLVMDTAAEANLLSLLQLQKVNESGSTDVFLNGVIRKLMGHNLRVSAGIASHTKGTATGFDAAALEPVGETTLAVDGNDSGTILNGDVVTFTGLDDKYIVKSSTASGGASGNIILNEPGLREALPDTTEGAIGDSYTANVAFHKSAVELAMRAPAQPPGGDLAKDVMVMTDPVSGLSVEFRLYAGYGMNKIEAKAYYGGKVWNRHMVATLLG